MSKRWDEIKKDLFKIVNEQDYERATAEIEAWAGYIENLENEKKDFEKVLDLIATTKINKKAVNVGDMKYSEARFIKATEQFGKPFNEPIQEPCEYCSLIDKKVIDALYWDLPHINAYPQKKLPAKYCPGCGAKI